MEVVVALAVGMAAGWLLGRRAAAVPPGGAEEPARHTRRPTKQQRRILATLPPDPPRPTLDELVAEELEETGAARIAGAAGLPPHIALKVFRSHEAELGHLPPERLRYVVADGVDPAAATLGDVTLETGEDPPVHSPG